MDATHEGPLEATTDANTRTGTSVEIGRGTHATIERDPTSGIVCKTFGISDYAERADLAQREFDYLKRFSTALASQQFVYCPEPISVEPEQGKVWMTYCPGSELHKALLDRDQSIDEHVEHLADQISIALQCYVAEFGEPYFDLATKNMIYEPSTRTLGLMDFTSRRRWRHPSSLATAFEVSVGVFLGLSICETVRPATWSNTLSWKRHERLSIALIHRLTSYRDLDFSWIRQVSDEVYGHSGKFGWPSRRPWSPRGLWYGTTGHLLFNRRRNTILSQSREGNDGIR